MARKTNKLPHHVNPIAIMGEDACALADELGLPVISYRSEISTAKAREMMAAAPVVAGSICLILGYRW